MEIERRRDQFLYFLGYSSNGTEKYLRKALENCAEYGCGNIFNIGIFEYCPFNDNLIQILRSYHIYVNGKKSILISILQDLIKEFVCLISDFITPCCSDGRAFYCKSELNLLCMECDRCNQVYDLDGNPIEIENRKLMVEADFVSFFGQNTASDWPYHLRLSRFVNTVLSPPDSIITGK